MANVDKDMLRSVFNLSKQLGKIPFPVVVKHSTGFDVIPINLTDPGDKDLVDRLTAILKKFLKTSTSVRSRYEGGRINEVGRRIEEALVNEMNKIPLEVKRLGRTGYPDIEISYSNRVTYLEMKTSSVQEESSFRYFYYTTGSKIKVNARHILLSISVTEESPRYWKVDNWVLSDLSKLSVELKTEFNATKGDLMDQTATLVSQ